MAKHKHFSKTVIIKKMGIAKASNDGSRLTASLWGLVFHRLFVPYFTSLKLAVRDPSAEPQRNNGLMITAVALGRVNALCSLENF